MPPVTILFVRSAFLYLVVGLCTGVAMEILPGLENASLAGVLRSEYVHMITVGWLTQLIFGVAYWMFPQPPGEQPSWYGKLPFIVYGLLNLGLVIRLVIEPCIRLGIVNSLSFFLVFSAALQFIAALGFVIIVWPRIRGKGNA